MSTLYKNDRNVRSGNLGKTRMPSTVEANRPLEFSAMCNSLRSAKSRSEFLQPFLVGLCSGFSKINFRLIGPIHLMVISVSIVRLLLCFVVQ